MGLLDSAGWNLDDDEVVQLERAALVAQLCKLDASLGERVPDDVWCPEDRTLDLSFEIDVNVAPLRVVSAPFYDVQIVLGIRATLVDEFSRWRVRLGGGDRSRSIALTGGMWAVVDEEGGDSEKLRLAVERVNVRIAKALKRFQERRETELAAVQERVVGLPCSSISRSWHVATVAYAVGLSPHEELTCPEGHVYELHPRAVWRVFPCHAMEEWREVIHHAFTIARSDPLEEEVGVQIEDAVGLQCRRGLVCVAEGDRSSPVRAVLWSFVLPVSVGDVDLYIGNECVGLSAGELPVLRI